MGRPLFSRGNFHGPFFLAQEIAGRNNAKHCALKKQTLIDVGGSVNVFLAAAFARVMSVAMPIPALASVSMLQSAAVGGSIVGVVGLSRHLGTQQLRIGCLSILMFLARLAEIIPQ